MGMIKQKIEFKNKSFIADERVYHELSSPSELNIPSRLVFQLQEKLKIHINLRMYLSFLLNRYRNRNYSNALPIYFGPKAMYQEKGQDLEVFGFRPYCKDWLELMLIARSRGASATLIFVKLLILDLSENGIPEGSGIRKLSFVEMSPKTPIRFLQVLDLTRGFRRRYVKFCRSPND